MAGTPACHRRSHATGWRDGAATRRYAHMHRAGGCCSGTVHSSNGVCVKLKGNTLLPDHYRDARNGLAIRVRRAGGVVFQRRAGTGGPSHRRRTRCCCCFVTFIVAIVTSSVTGQVSGCSAGRMPQEQKKTRTKSDTRIIA